MKGDLSETYADQNAVLIWIGLLHGRAPKGNPALAEAQLASHRWPPLKRSHMAEDNKVRLAKLLTAKAIQRRQTGDNGGRPRKAVAAIAAASSAGTASTSTLAWAAETHNSARRVTERTGNP